MRARSHSVSPFFTWWVEGRAVVSVRTVAAESVCCAWTAAGAKSTSASASDGRRACDDDVRFGLREGCDVMNGCRRVKAPENNGQTAGPGGRPGYREDAAGGAR